MRLSPFPRHPPEIPLMVVVVVITVGGFSFLPSATTTTSTAFVVHAQQDTDDDGTFSSSQSSSTATMNTEGLPNLSRPVVVHLPDLGRVQGKRESGVDFFGRLPYAAPPVGTRRFAPPEPTAPWAPAKLDATQYGPDCWQLVDPVMNPGADESLMSEDCLYLNIHVLAGQEHASGSTSSSGSATSKYAHQKHSQQKQQQNRLLLPVMVWLHGGAFQQGGARRAEYDGRRLAERGTVVVTLNYRLGALGFLVSSEDGIFGNFGLMDQRAALHWIQDNIAYFGGDPGNVMLFGESAGAVMTMLHLMMEGAGKLFHKVAIQSNPLGLQFRSIVVADFLGEALKRAVDCRDLACLRAERVEEIMRAQSSLMGVPRSVGDFFTWGPTLTDELKLILGGQRQKGPLGREHVIFRDLNSWKWQSRGDHAWSTVNVTQPLKDYHRVPDNIPIIIGANKHEGEMFVHGAFPITMSKAVYWLFVGALFRDSASRVLKHYRGYVDQIEREAQELAKRQMEEEENRQFYFEHREELDREYQILLAMNASKTRPKSEIQSLLQAWSRRGGAAENENGFEIFEEDSSSKDLADAGVLERLSWFDRLLWFRQNLTVEEIAEKELRRQHLIKEKARLREVRKKEKAKERALKRAAKVSVDYRPVMSRIIDDYLFRCPAWHLAQSVSRQRVERGKTSNVFVYQFSHSTHIPGYKECWGKSCHTSEIPYVFEAMDIIRTNYSTLGPYAQEEAPTSPDYPYTEMLAAYRGAMEAAEKMQEQDAPPTEGAGNYTRFSRQFQRLLNHFFGDYFKENADEEIASDMADRWVSFAYSGDPNYDGSRAKWHPWRYIMDESYSRGERLGPWQSDDLAADFDRIFNIEIPQEVDEEKTDDYFIWSEDPEEQIYRRRALNALGFQVIEEDVFQTMLRRTKQEDELETLFDSFPYGSSARSKEAAANQEERARRAVSQMQQIAQDMGVIGTGLRGEAKKGGLSDVWEESFFPELLELKWPPEGRLVERDCTCDFWAKIRYRY